MAVDSDRHECVRRIARRMRGNIFGGTVRVGILSCTYVMTFAACLPACSMSRGQAGPQGIFYFTMLSKSDFYFKRYVLKPTCIIRSLSRDGKRVLCRSFFYVLLLKFI